MSKDASSPLDAPTTREEFVAWAIAAVQSEADATERALDDQPDMPRTASHYLTNLRYLLERITIGDVIEVTYPLPTKQTPVQNEVDLALADLDPDEQLVPVVLAVHNGLVVSGNKVFVQHFYEVPITLLGKVQGALDKHQIGWSA